MSDATPEESTEESALHSAPTSGSDTTSEESTEESTEESAQHGGSPSKDASRRGWVAPLAIALAVIALLFAVWGYFNPRATKTTANPHLTDEQISSAKARACGAFQLSRAVVSAQFNAAPPSNDPVAAQATAANRAVAMTAGATYLFTHLDPATPPALGTALTSYANAQEEFAMNGLANAPGDDPAQAARNRDGEVLAGRITELCK